MLAVVPEKTVLQVKLGDVIVFENDNFTNRLRKTAKD